MLILSSLILRSHKLKNPFLCANSNVRERAKYRRSDVLHAQGMWPDTRGHRQRPETGVLSLFGLMKHKKLKADNHVPMKNYIKAHVLLYFLPTFTPKVYYVYMCTSEHFLARTLTRCFSLLTV